MKISNNDISNVLRILSIDMIENAKSGHPGAPMGMADIFEVLWRKYINHNPSNTNWINRDRFILSNGHCSALLYSTLHLLGYKISIKDLKNFRKINSITPGHPEKNKNLGIEVTTGPLGQGLANAVGLAIGEKIFSNTFNVKDINLINHKTYVFVGDGCLMEGISHEVCSLAGTLKLNKLIVLYDSNNISIDGNIKYWFTENIKKRFLSYKWNVISNIDGHNRNEIVKSIKKAMISNKPSIIIFKTIIGFGSPNKSNSNISHGTPLGEDEILNVRYNLQWKFDKFIIPKYIYKKWCSKKNGYLKEKKWNIKLDLYKKLFPKLFYEFNRRINSKLPKILENEINNYIKNLEKNNDIISTRKASQNIINKIIDILPELIGGSSDLTSSNLTNSYKSISINKNFKGNYINFGVRELGMSAISNGISCYNGFIPYNGTFLTFMDYAKSALRMAALMNIKNIFIYTHDSIRLGEDGPTHQPIEHLSNLRTIPNLITWRPCDEMETLFAWKNAIYRKNGPTAIILSRQNLTNIIRNKNTINNIEKGGYILYDVKNHPKITIISTGSEIELSIKIKKELDNMNYFTRIVSMPSTNIFDIQDEEYKNNIIFNDSFKVIIEAGHPDYWYKYITNNKRGMIFGIKTFGKSGSEYDLVNYFNLTESKIINEILKKIKL